MATIKEAAERMVRRYWEDILSTLKNLRDEEKVDPNITLEELIQTVTNKLNHTPS